MNTDTPQPPPFFPGEPTPPPSASLPDQLDLRAILDALLRRPKDLVQRLSDPGSGALLRFIGIAVVSMIVFGIVLGSFAMHEQLWAAPVKITGGLLIAGLICFPSLYIFSCLAGSRASASQLAATLAGMLALAGLLLLGFAPAVWIFTQATNAFGFMGVLAVTPWLVAMAFGMRFLHTAIGLTGATGKAPINVWSCIFLLVTLQMTTSLRPILGRESYFLTDEKKFFIQHWIEVSDESLNTSTTRIEAPVPTP
jgi:hypothetical protein